MTTIGGLFFGYGGLDMAAQSVFCGDLAWVSEIDKGACKVIGHRYPGVPNLGDVTAVDWAAVPPVDIMTGGSPCQDVSQAGRRAGMRSGTRSGLWASMREGIAALRPRLVIWENVRGVFSAEADSELEYCPGCMGDPRNGVAVLRALGRVLGDLSDLGYGARWCGLRAADVGAPHGRFRVFVAAYPRGEHGEEWRLTAPVEAPGGWSFGEPTGCPGTSVNLLPTPDTGQTPNGHGRRGGRPGNGHQSGSVASLLPTPQAHDAKGAKSADQVAAMRASGAGGMANLNETAEHHLADGTFGPYADAVARWERITRPAPPPTEPRPNGKPRLNAAFSEWMMGIPAGHVTAVPGVSRAESLRCIGNGVVPQQGAEALRRMFSVMPGSSNESEAVV